MNQTKNNHGFGKKTVLFICKNNSGRSQMAEGLLKHHYGDYYEVYSAGIEPRDVNPLTIKLMDEINIDITDSKSKSLEKFQETEFDYVVALCGDNASSCPIFPGGKKYIHRSFLDPADFKKQPNKEELFRQVRDDIQEWILEEFEVAKK